MKLTFKDFDKNGTCVSWQGEKVEIRFEPCLNGCDVAVYDLKMNLLEPKYCTDIKGWQTRIPEEGVGLEGIKRIAEMRKRAIIKANEFYQKHEVKNNVIPTR